MALADIDRPTSYRFAIGARDPLRIIFANQEMLGPELAGEPLWHHEAPSSRLLDAMIRWLALRRDRWDAWGKLAERVGPPAFGEHLRQEMAAEPVATRPCTVVQYLDDPTELLIGEMRHGADGFVVQPLHQHRFATAAARDRFREWLDMSGDEGIEAMIRATLLDGVAALGAALDDISRPRASPSQAS